MISDTMTIALAPTSEQAKLIDKTIMSCGMLWNRMISDEAKLQEELGKRYVPTPAKYKREFPELKTVDSMALSSMHHRLMRQFQDHDYNPHDYPRPAPVSRMNSYTTYSRMSSGGFLIRLEEGGIRLPKLGLVPVKQGARRSERKTILSAIVLKEDGEYYCKAKFEAPAAQPAGAMERQPT